MRTTCYALLGLVILAMTATPGSGPQFARISSGKAGQSLAQAVAASPPEETLACSTSIAFGESVDCSIGESAETDEFTFDAVAGHRVRVRLAENSGSLYAFLDILRPDGMRLCSTYADTLDCTTTQSGTHRILVKDDNTTDTGTYGLYLQRLSDPVGCPSLSFGALPTSGTLDVPVANHCFAFDSDPGDRLRARVDETAGSLYAFLEFLNPDGTRLCSTFADILDCTASQEGTFHLFIGDDNGLNSGSFSAYLQRLSNPVGCRGISYGGSAISGSVEAAADYACFTFTGKAGDRIRTNVAEVSAALYALQEVINPDGTRLCFSYAESLDCNLSQVGEYKLFVSDDNGLDLGDFQASLLCLTQGCGSAVTPVPTASPTPKPTKTPTPWPSPSAWFYMSITSKNMMVYYEGDAEREENDAWFEANGPLQPGKEYSGFPEDDKDFFSIYLQQAGRITIDLTGHTGQGVQILLYEGSTENLAGRDFEPPYHLEHVGGKGVYFIFVFSESGFNQDAAYTLKTGFP